MLQPLEKKIPKIRKQRKVGLTEVKEPTEKKAETPKKKSVKKRCIKRNKAKLVEGSSELKSKGEGGEKIQENTAGNGLTPQKKIESIDKDTKGEKVCEAIHEEDTKEIKGIEDNTKKKNDRDETKLEQAKKMHLLFKRFRRKKEQSRFEKAMKIVKEHKRRKNKLTAVSEPKSETKKSKTNKKIVEVL